jgi:excisionase family DNA binding protein
VHAHTHGPAADIGHIPLPDHRRGSDQEPHPTGHPEDLLTVDEVIASLRVSRATFYRWRRRGSGPASVRLPGGTVRVRRAALADWLASLQDANKKDAAA